MQGTDTLQIESIDPQHPQALALLAEAAEEARVLYPELFAPDAPAPANTPLRAREVYLVAQRNGQVVGCGALRQKDAFTGEVRRMFVTRRARRDGVARALLMRLEREVLETGARQRAAIALYGETGWRRIPAWGPFVGDTMSVCFGKALASRR
jgi:putative acetyltransferase